ncbi:MAG: NUDIX hydrolase, partial [Deltaproteobacteria bacterium]|nr:NUDIX hydrolase [Deltaproteobacteria bacterium]
MINALIRAVYRVAHWGLRLLWFIRRPETTGALVAVWHQGRVLLVKNSYRRQLTLPGGYIRPREDRRTAAARELREEVGVQVQPKHLVHAYHGTHVFEHRQDTLDIYELEVEEAPDVRVDDREVVRAEFHTPDEALR